MSLTVIDKTVEVLGRLIPPPADDPEFYSKSRTWAKWIAGVTIMNAGALTLHIVLACGWASPWYPGFAQAGELKHLSAEVKAQRLNTLQKDLLDIRQKQCEAPTGSQLRLMYAKSVNDMLQEYQRLANEPYPLLDCAEFKPPDAVRVTSELR